MSRKAGQIEVLTFGFRGFPDVQGGIETHVEHLAPRLVERGIGVTACVRSPYVGSQNAGAWKGVRLLRVWTVRQTQIETVLHSLLCAVLAGLLRPDIVHIHGVGPALFAPLVRLLGLKVVVTHHGPDYDREKWGTAAKLVLRAGEALGMRYAHRRIVISDTIRRIVEERYGTPCVVVPNGIVVQRCPLGLGIVSELELEPGRYILTVGRLVPEKRQSDLIRAFEMAGLAGWKLVIVGAHDHDSSYARSLIRQAQATPGVIVAGFQTGDELRRLYGNAGLFVLPSSHEGLAIVLLEAMSYGLPVLVSDIPPNLEILRDPARSFPTGDIAALADRLGVFCAQRDSAAERDRRRDEVARRYDWDAIAAAIGDVFTDMVGADQAAAANAGLRVPDGDLRERARTE